MERSAKTFASTLFLSFLLLLLAVETEGAKITVPASGINPRPLCASQYVLANYACSMIPFSPLPPPSPSTPTLDAHHRRRKHGHHHHHHNHRHSGTKEEADCCRWLNEIDTDCVCEMLVRLPDFLSKPVHEYSLIVGDTCTVTYTCGGRVIRKK